MNHYYRTPQNEEGLQNVILQNRCGNRLTLLVREGHTELEFLYRPNAYRNKDFASRNFSNRDLQTNLFGGCEWPDISSAADLSFAYDPFHTRVMPRHASGAANVIHLLNMADENAFVIAARAPLMLAFRPHRAFVVRDGLMMEKFRDRGRDIVSFVQFPGFEASRFRVLEDGTHVLQVLADDPVLVGGEENEAQVERVLRRFAGKSIVALLAENEATIDRDLAAGQARLEDAKYQEVYDLNRRIGWSSIDAGGACCGALNRIYQLIWVRDGSMSSVHHALAGNPEFIRIWAPFLWANPTEARTDEGATVPEFGQMLGTRWSKSEDDGLFYATWALFIHFRTTGDDRLLRSGALDLLKRAIDAQLGRCWDAASRLMISDTLGEEALRGNPYHGYDIVTGALQDAVGNVRADGRLITRVATFYHQANTCNLLRMALCLVEAIDGETAATAAWRTRLAELEESVAQQFIDSKGEPYCLRAIFEDGSTHWTGLDEEPDPWEYAWAVAQGPFFPWWDAQRRGAIRLIEEWPRRARRSYGLCPWNVLNRSLHEWGLLSAEASAENLREEVEEALTTPRKYPMKGSLHEDHRRPDALRGLPFTIGSFVLAQTARLLAPLPQGIAVRDGGLTRELRQFRYRLATIDVRRRGEGPQVRRWWLNGELMPWTLQIPETALRAGRNEVVVELGDTREHPRLYGSDAELLAVLPKDDSTEYVLRSPLRMNLEFEGCLTDVRVTEDAGSVREYLREAYAARGRTIVTIPIGGTIRVSCRRA